MLNINQVKTFLMVVDEGSLSSAAEKLGITQPAVSSHINNLEYYLGTTLFERTGSGRSSEITEAGKILYEKGKELIKTYKNIEEEIINNINDLKNNIKIGAGPIIANYILPHVIALYRKINRTTEIDITPTETDLIIKGLLDYDFDIGFVGFPINNSKITFEKWIKDELEVIVPANHKFAKLKEITVDDLLDQDFIWQKELTGIQMFAMHEFKKIGKSLQMNSSIEATSTLQVIACVQAGLGISILSKLIAESYVKAGMISTVKVKDLNLTRDLYIATPNFKRLPTVVKNFIQSAREFKKFKGI